MHKALSKSGSGSRRAIDSDGCDSPRCRDSVRSITEADHRPAPGIPRNVSAACLFAVLNVCDCCKKEATGPRHGVSRQKILDTERVAINTGRLENFGYAAKQETLAGLVERPLPPLWIETLNPLIPASYTLFIMPQGVQKERVGVRRLD